jgi:hypothetical protein
MEDGFPTCQLLDLIISNIGAVFCIIIIFFFCHAKHSFTRRAEGLNVNGRLLSACYNFVDQTSVLQLGRLQSHA